MKMLYSALCALLGLSVMNKIYQENCHFLKSYYYLVLEWEEYLINIVNVFNLNWVLILIVLNALRLAFYKVKLTSNEIMNLKQQSQYNLFEFIWGFVILRNIEDLGLLESVKYCISFSLIMIVKNFHYLLDLRLNNSHNRGPDDNSNSCKLFIFIISFIIFDSLTWVYINSHDESPTLKLFAYEVVDLLVINLVMMNKMLKQHVHERWGNTNNYIELTMNLIKFFVISKLIYRFQRRFIVFPFHIIPTLYKNFRLILNNLRNLIGLQRNKIKFARFHSNLISVETKHDLHKMSKNEVCFCLEELDIDEKINGDNNDIKMLKCRHAFHFNCLKYWLIKSDTCPICRERIYNEGVSQTTNIQQEQVML